MTSKRRPTRSTPLHTPALARTHRLGEAVAQALGHNAIPAPAMSMGITSKRSVARAGGWGSGPWQHGRSLSHAPQMAAPTWHYPSISTMGANAAHQGGIALLELMLVIGVIAIGTAGVVATYRVVDNNRKVNEEVEHATTIAQNIVATSVVAGDFHLVNQDNALREGVFPKDMLDASGDPHSAWGGDVLLTSTNIDGKPNWGTVLTFDGVPASACAKLVTQAAPGFYAVSVNSHAVRTNYGPVDVAALSAACSDNARVQFTYAKHGGAGEALDALSPCTVPAPTTDVIVDVACPPGQLGTVTFRTDSVCPAPYGPATDLPAVQTGSTCTPQCVLPSPASQNNVETQTTSQSLACPPGQSSTTGGTLGITQTRQEQRSQTRTASCPPSPGFSGPVGPYAWSTWTPFSPWAATTPWAPSTNTCAPNCATPAPTTETGNQTGACLPGRVTPTGSTAFPQTRTRSVSYSCPAQTGSATAIYGTWSPWSPPESTACATQCVVPTPATQTNTETQTGTQTFSCPSGQIITTAGPYQYQGSAPQTRTEQRSQTRTGSCPSPVSAVSYTPWSSFSPWAGTTPWSPSFTCAPSCTAPAPVVTAESQGATCTTGRVTPAGSTAFTQTRNKTVSYTCSSPSGSLYTSTTTYSPWTPTEAAACATQCVAPAPAPETATQTASCLAGRVTPTGGTSFTQTQSRAVTYSCSSPTGSVIANPGTWSAWSPTEATACAAQCSAPQTLNTPQSQTFTCTAGQLITTAGPSQYTSSGPQTRVKTDTYSCPAPTGAFTTATSYTPWTPAYTCAPTCSAPADVVTTTPQTQSASCPAGELTPAGPSTFTQSRVRTNTQGYSCPSPTGAYTTDAMVYSYSAWTPTAATACDPACSAPADVNTPQSQTFTCPAGQLITTAGPYQYTPSGTQTRVKTQGYSCPAPTGAYSADALTYTPWTPAFACAPTCSAPADVVTTTPQSATGTCAAGEVTSTGATTFTQSRVRTNTQGYSCPAPTGAYTADPVVYTYTAYSPTAATACNPQCTPPASQTQWVPTSDTACPAGTSGTRTYQIQQKRDGTCGGPWGPAGYGGWYNTGATQLMNTSGCTPIANPCVVPSVPAVTRSWTEVLNCNGTVTAGTYPSGSSTAHAKQGGTLKMGDAYFLCTNGVLATTASAGATCDSAM